MRLIEEIKKLRKTELVNYSILISILIYSTIFGFWFSGLSSGVINTIESIIIPNGYFNASLSSSNPVFYDLTDLNINLSLDVKYFEKITNDETLKTVFIRNENIGVIPALQLYENIIKGEENDFKLDSLVDFESNANMSRIIRYFLRVEISGRFFYNSIPFKLNIKEIDLYIL
jgi:hypothetical protein